MNKNNLRVWLAQSTVKIVSALCACTQGEWANVHLTEQCDPSVQVTTLHNNLRVIAYYTMINASADMPGDCIRSTHNAHRF